MVDQYAKNRKQCGTEVRLELKDEEYSEQRVADLLIRDLSFMDPKDPMHNQTRALLVDLGYSTGG